MTKENRKRPGDFLHEGGNLLGNIFKKANHLVELNKIVQSALEPPLNQHCHVSNLEQGRLTIATDSAEWKTLLRFQVPALLEKLRKEYALPYLTGITCKIILPEPLISSQKTLKPPPTLSAKSANYLQEVAEEIDHERLKKALENLASRR